MDISEYIIINFRENPKTYLLSVIPNIKFTAQIEDAKLLYFNDSEILVNALNYGHEHPIYGVIKYKKT